MIALSFSPFDRRLPSPDSFEPVLLVDRSLVSFGVPLSLSRPASQQALATNWGHLLESGLSLILLVVVSSGFGPKAPCDGTGGLHFGSHTVISIPGEVSPPMAITSELAAWLEPRRAINAREGASNASSPVPTGRSFVTAA